jgi:shikimate dehydrogenase
MPGITGKTKIVGLFGFPVEHSLSPMIHNAAFKALGLDYCYVPYSVRESDVESAVGAIRSLGMVGVNVTAPHKQAVIPFLDELTPEASFLQAVNTIVHTDGRLTGHNTDATGYLTGLSYNLAPEELSQGKAIILGGGGAARAAAMGLAQGSLGRITMALRAPEKMDDWLRAFREHYPAADIKTIPLHGDELKGQLRDATLLINSLPSMVDENMADWFQHILAQARPHTFFSDLRYDPPETAFLKMGMSLGCRVQNGLPMLLEQAILSYKLFVGQEAPEHVMREALGL